MTISTKDHCPLVYILTPSYNCGQYYLSLIEFCFNADVSKYRNDCY